ncbi:MAG TPA: toll/interleukin-1 receptor domain-containing protein [Pyrinomonadaceae bacterium]|nr:toll/interleukin-1 receptor domain-containing protein [Pyrinomonadaceae bacterium]
MSSSSFANDLFISYAHIDNLSVSSDQGWIDLLHERLRIRLAQLLGKPPRIWRDRKLKGYDVFDDTIVIALEGSAIMVSIVSPRYVESDYCRSEIDNFVNAACEQVADQLGDKRRIIRVVKTYVPYGQHHPALRDILPYEFYERNEDTGRVHEFDHEISAQGDKDKRYWNKFEDLVWDLHELIKLLENPEPVVPKPAGATIYLAETTSDLSQERDKVKRELTQFGHVVLPDKPLPLEVNAFKQTVSNYLSNSQLSIHLIGEHYGIIPEMETERSIVRLQEELAVQRGDDAHFSRLIWMPPGLQPKDERQKQFVVHLQNSFSSHNGSELLQVKLEDLKTIIQSKLDRKAKPAAVESDEASTVRIYLICDPQDAEAAEPIQSYLIDCGFETTLPLMSGTDAEILEDHKDNLLLCDAVLIYHGRASEGWLRMKLRELLKLPGYGRTTPLLEKAIYMGGPVSPLKEKFKVLEASVTRNYGDFVPATLEPFIARIRKAKGESR